MDIMDARTRALDARTKLVDAKLGVLGIDAFKRIEALEQKVGRLSESMGDLLRQRSLLIESGQNSLAAIKTTIPSSSKRTRARKVRSRTGPSCHRMTLRSGSKT